MELLSRGCQITYNKTERQKQPKHYYRILKCVGKCSVCEGDNCLESGNKVFCHVKVTTYAIHEAIVKITKNT